MNARPAPPTVPPPRFRRGPVIAGIAVAIALVLGGWGLWRVLAGGAGDDATPAQLRAFLLERIAPFKVPLEHHIWLTDEALPRLGTQKIDKRTVKARFTAEAVAA